MLLITKKKKDVTPFAGRKFILVLNFKTNFRHKNLMEEKPMLERIVSVLKNRFMANSNMVFNTNEPRMLVFLVKM